MNNEKKVLYINLLLKFNIEGTTMKISRAWERRIYNYIKGSEDNYFAII